MADEDLKEKLFLKMVGGNIRRYRKAKGLTLRQLGEKVKISPSYIGQVENCKETPRLPTLFRICEALDLCIIFYDKDIKKTKNKTP